MVEKSLKKFLFKILSILSWGQWGGIGVILTILFFIIPYFDLDDQQKHVSKTTPVISETSRKEDSDRESKKRKHSILLRLVSSINSLEQENIHEIYEDLLFLVKSNNASNRLISIVEKWKDPLSAVRVDETVIISTAGQYKIDGFILFFDTVEGKLLSADYDFPLGIKAINFFNTRLSAPQYLLSVKYMTQSGTGLYGESVRVYAIENGNIALALDKPYMEYVDGSWGAYSSNVTFEQNMRLEVDEELLKVVATGRVTYKNKDDQPMESQLPKEVYIWDKHYNHFRQTEGVKTSGHRTMSGVYANFAEPIGNWFESPGNISDKSFKPDDW